MLGKLYLTFNDSGLRILDNSAIRILYGTIADNRHDTRSEWVIGRHATGPAAHMAILQFCLCMAVMLESGSSAINLHMAVSITQELWLNTTPITLSHRSNWCWV